MEKLLEYLNGKLNVNFGNPLIVEKIKNSFDKANLSNFHFLRFFKKEFKYKNVHDINFWLERGFSEEYGLKEIEKTSLKKSFNSKTRAKEKRKNYLTYKQCKIFAIENGIKTKEEWIKFIKPKNVPSCPDAFYEEWEGWDLFLRNEIYKKKYRGIYYSYKECKKTVQKLSIKSKSDWFKKIGSIIEKDIKIPYDPSKIYEEWEGWGYFIGTNRVQDNLIKHLTFEEARNYARSLNFKLCKEWRMLDPNDLPIGITKQPNRTYKNEWLGWLDWLGIDIKTKMSYGEKLIMDSLIKRDIKFKYDNSLKDCKLRFDFYLPEHNICIEYDGIQHFKPVEKFGGKEEFEKMKIRDQIKNEWCLKNRIKLIRFSYKDNIDYIHKTIEKL